MQGTWDSAKNSPERQTSNQAIQGIPLLFNAKVGEMSIQSLHIFDFKPRRHGFVDLLREGRDRFDALSKHLIQKSLAEPVPHRLQHDARILVLSMESRFLVDPVVKQPSGQR